MMQSIFPALYILAAAGFILAIKWMSSPATARRGVFVGEAGMLLAVVGTLLRAEVVTYQWIFIAFFIGSAIGVPIAYYMPMTAVPQRTAFSHACGALAAALIGTAEYYRSTPHGVVMTALVLEILLGFLTFTASMMAFGKLQEILPTRPITYPGQNFVNLGIFGLAAVTGIALIIRPDQAWLFPIFAVLSLLFGVLFIVPIGGADMPTVIALLNSYAGSLRQRDGLCLQQQAAHHRRRARWLVGIHPRRHHVPGDEPVFQQCLVRRLWHGSGQREEDGRAARALRFTRKRRPKFSMPRAK